MNGKYLSDFKDEITLEKNCLNLITTPCGSGKTTYALDLLKEKVDNFENVLYLIDGKIAKQQILRRGKRKINYDTEQEYWEIDGVRVMTYAGYATLCEKAPEKDIYQTDTTIICDEFHSCIEWAKWNNEDNINRMALNIIATRINIGNNTVLAMSATPDCIKKEFDYCLNEIKIDGNLMQFEDNSTEEYYNITQLLSKIKCGEKGIIYIPHITDIKKYQNILNNRGIKTGSFWSLSNTDHPMTNEQKKLREYVIDNAEIPDDIDVLFINKSCETSVNIFSHIDFMIIHTSDADTRVQARGRYRDDLDRLYLYSADAYYDEKIIVPDEWLNKRLRKSDVDELIKSLNIKDESRHLVKKPTFIKWLKDDDYEVQEKKIKGGERYIIISK